MSARLPVRLRGAYRLSRPYCAPGIKLTGEAAESTGPVWVQVAKAGVFRGHQTGTVVFDEVLFRNLVDNFRAHPSYEAGTDGVGKARVVPFDYEHASERDPVEGDLAVHGAPAPAWALELEMRQGDEGAELWALTDLSPEARQQIRAGGYLWTSVAIWQDAIHPVTGENVGAVLTSVAFTNHPFIQGMAPLAARMRTHRVEVWGEAESPEEVIVGLRDILELAEDAPVDALRAELQALAVASLEGRSGPAYPEGVGFLLDQVRRLVGARVLAPTDEILVSAGQALDAAAQQPTGTPPPAPPEDPTMAAPTNQLASQLATILKCRDSDESILMAVKQSEESSNAVKQLQELFGSSDTQDLLKRASEAIAEAEKAKGLVAALQAAQEGMGSDEEEEVATTTEQVAASSRRLGKERARDIAIATVLCKSFVAARKRLDDMDGEAAGQEVDAILTTLGLSDVARQVMRPKLLAERVAAGRSVEALQKFRAGYPQPHAPHEQLLHQTMVAGAGGAQFGGSYTGLPQGGQPPVQTFAGAGGARPAAPQQPGAGGQPGQQHPMLSYPGRNTTEKAMAYLGAKREGFKLLARQDQVHEAGNYLRAGAPAL